MKSNPVLCMTLGARIFFVALSLMLTACRHPLSPTTIEPPDIAPLAESHLYQPPALPPASRSLSVDNVYSMQILTLPSAARMQALGRSIFFDKSLSASGRMSCATCHDPAFAYGPANALDVQMGGADLNRMGNRAVPSLRYKERMPAFMEHFIDEDVPAPTGQDQGPTGGYGWDGHFPTLHNQAALPLLAKNEMANASITDIVNKLRRADYEPLFQRTFGEHSLDDDVIAFKWMTLALEYFQRDQSEFYPFSSKYDAYLRGEVSLTEAETRGMNLFNDPEKGNCMSCHTSRRGKTGAMPDFTDFGLVALGVPRNTHLDINKDPGAYDLGLCGPFRQDLTRHAEYCGAFRTPSLRNVALRKSFFHNGVFHSLRQVLEFYATRETDPGRWYPRAEGAGRYNDLPVQYRKNVNQGVPFKPDAKGHPRLSHENIDDILAFLGTLTDGYSLAKH